MSSHRPITTALLSYGMSGEVFHAPLLTASEGFTLKTVLQRKSDKARQHYPHLQIVRSIEEITGDPEVELVIVNTPNELHYEFTRQVIEAGKHVVVEKPFTNTREEGEKLIELAATRKVVLSVFQNRRWDGDFMTVKKVVESGALGHIVEFEAHYDRFRNYIDKNTWKEEPGPGSGILYNLGSHMLDQVLVLFGMPAAVDARMGIQRPQGKVDDFYDIRLEYPGLNVIVKSSYLVRESGPRYVLHGVEGSFIKYGLDPQEQALKEKLKPGQPGWGTDPEAFWGKLNAQVQGLHFEGKIETIPGNYLLFYQDIFKAIREGKDLSVKPEESLQVIELIEASIQSNRERKAVSF